MKEFICKEASRLDMFVAQSLQVSRTIAKRLVQEGGALVNGKPRAASYTLQVGDIVAASTPEPQQTFALPQEIPLAIVYEDDHLLVIDKPIGMVVHPGAGNKDGTLVNALLHHTSSLSEINGDIRPGIVHRLDKDTSGLMLAAKTDAAHAALAADLAEHKILRKYIALVHGIIKEESGTIDRPIGRSTTDRKRFTVAETNSKSAITHYEVLQRFTAYTLISCRLETGRTHQIRVHMAHRGNPVVGDKTYGVKRESIKTEAQLLHSTELAFTHPITGENLSFSTEMPERFAKTMKKLF